MGKLNKTLTQKLDLSTKGKIHLLTEYIGKVILLNADFDKKSGLFNGSMGSAIYLYNLDKYSETAFFHNFANELIANINAKINFSNSSYTNGTTGVSWGINYLCKNEFIENEEIDLVLGNFDDAYLTNNTDYTLDIELHGGCCYLLNRLTDKKNDNFSLTYLLIQERVITHLEMLTNPFFADDYLNDDILEQMLDRKLQPQFFKHEINNICTSVIVLNKAKKLKIYTETVDKARKIISRKITDYLNSFSEYLLKIPHNNNSSLYLNLLFRLYYSHLTLSFDLEMDKKFDFPSFLSLVSYDNQIANLNYSDWYQEISLITTLLRLKHLENSTSINNFIDNKLQTLILNLYDKRKLESAIYPNKHPLNLGLTGLAGLGMSLLQILIPEIADWDESLLIS